MKTTEDIQLEGDDRSIMTGGWRARAVIQARHDQPSQRTLVLSVSDGPEVHEHFDPSRALENIGATGSDWEDRCDDDSDGSLLDAIGKAATAIAEERARDEAFHWIHEHEDCYVILGRSGEGVDRATWPVTAFLREDRARSECEELNCWLDSRGYDVPGDETKYREIIEARDKIPDKGFRYDHRTGTRYEVVAVPIDMAHAWSDSDPADR